MIYNLKHEDKLIAVFQIEDNRYIKNIKINKNNTKFLPIGVSNGSELKNWIEIRGIPVTRQGLKAELQWLGVQSSFELMLLNNGLSLSDHYWICEINSDLSWSDVNLYVNDFKSTYSLDLSDDVQSIAGKTNFTPSTSLRGDLKKKWIIDGKRVRRLVKGNYNNTCRQSISEVFATEIHRKQSLMPYTKYKLIEISSDKQNIIGCECPNFTTLLTEFVPAIDIVNNLKKPNDISYYEFFIKICEEHDLSIRPFLEYQIMSDFLITNTDRHFNNFGIIRRSDNLDWVSPAPIFDSGNSLFYNSSYIPTGKELLKTKVTSFLSKEVQLLSYVKNRGILDLNKLPSEDDLYRLLIVDTNTKDEVNDKIIKAYKEKIKYLGMFQNGANIWKFQYN